MPFWSRQDNLRLFIELDLFKYFSLRDTDTFSVIFEIE